MREKQKLKTLYRKVEQREVGAPRAKRLVSIPTSEQVNQERVEGYVGLPKV